MTQSLGKVFLVGAGPGDPELLTLKALKAMQQAEVVLYDRLVSPEVMALLPEHCQRIYVGKRRADHSVPQEDISDLLVQYAREGKCTVRLKGGDPFIFGRGGEELQRLAEHQIPFQVIPGITAASGCAAAAAIPLTHRDYSQAVQFITGHLKDDHVNLDWPALAPANQTLVFYMGLIGFPQIAQKLIEMGRDGATPLAIVEQGTTAQQKVHLTSLADVGQLLATTPISPPTLIIVGDVVNLHQLLYPVSV